MKKKIIGIIVCFFLMTPLIASATGNDKERPSEWIEDFDSYSNGQILDGTSDDGGWKGWGNNSAYGATVTNTMSHSLPHSVDIHTDSDLVHEFSGYTSGQWVFTAWQYIPNDFVGESAFILLDIYSDPGTDNNWATQINFNSTTNLVISEFEDVTLPLIKGQWVELRNVINLDNDTQYFYYDGTLLTNKSWTEGVSGGGVLDIAAVDLFANGASTIYYDDISLRYPYTLTINIVGNGTVTKNPDQLTYLYNTPVELTATPDTDWTFSHWSGDLTGDTNPVTIYMTQNKTITTHFTPSAATLTIDLYKEWNLITIPLENTWTAETLGQNITGCTVVIKFDGDTQLFTTHVVNTPHDNFPVLNGESYFIYCAHDTNLTITGLPLGTTTVHIYQEWNLIGWFTEIPTTAESLGTNITDCNVVIKFDGDTQLFTTHVVNTPHDNFSITRGMGLFIYATSESDWHGEG